MNYRKKYELFFEEHKLKLSLAGKGNKNNCKKESLNG